ncbi:hypothetical protein FHX41_4716 [Actinomadura hallensis]|uniref:Uncharacterized protein n=1 Tax=Actinomadura hallensis TaxID=337895 RepID=A0A543IK79_9ACTN|nr:hypothetical protein [Actinomadura hallensis]TQM70967.1 hypothetical protein FHX41_4716 [Actinomadura hallensis]HLV74824.1 hypothetical protein [Vulgatibacteraceae bacterium]
MSSAVRRAWRRLALAYHRLCARDDAVTHGFAVPSGVWACDRCHQPHLELAALLHHVRTEHP